MAGRAESARNGPSARGPGRARARWRWRRRCIAEPPAPRRPASGQGEVRRHRCRERAAGAVRVGPGYTRLPKGAHRHAVEQQVHDFGRIGVPTLDHHRGGTERRDTPRRFLRIVLGTDRHPGQRLGFGQIRRHHGGERQQRRAQRLDGVGRQERIAALGHHHRIDDQVRHAQLAHCGGHRPHQFGGGQHPRLGGPDVEVGDDRPICSRTTSADTTSTAETPCVFCAVMAVMAHTPYTPCAANVLRSAWMPAPAPESLPAMVSATGTSAIARARRPRRRQS